MLPVEKSEHRRYRKTVTGFEGIRRGCCGRVISEHLHRLRLSGTRINVYRVTIPSKARLLVKAHQARDDKIVRNKCGKHTKRPMSFAKDHSPIKAVSCSNSYAERLNRAVKDIDIVAVL